MHWLNRILLAALIAAAVAFGPEQFELAAGTSDLERVLEEREQLRTDNETLREEIDLLRSEIEALETDASEVARIAREDLNLVRPGEVVFEVDRGEPAQEQTPR